jgi:hypothetical protein
LRKYEGKLDASKWTVIYSATLNHQATKVATPELLLAGLCKNGQELGLYLCGLGAQEAKYQHL